MAGQAQDVIERLAEVIEGSAQAAMQMVAGGRQQTSGVEQIALAMQNINRATEQGMASTRQVTQAARDLWVGARVERDRGAASGVEKINLAYMSI